MPIAHNIPYTMSSKQSHLSGGPCPRCNSGWYSAGRSLSVHLTMHCTSALLWDHVSSRKSSASKLKRSHTQMRNESTATFVQQARTFNSVPDEVPVQIRHPLMSQPSLSCLASMPNEFYCNDSSNTEFNTNPTGVEPDSNSVCGSVTNAVDRSSTDRDVNLENKPLTIEQCSFQRNSIFLPPDIAFQVHLASVLQ